MGARHDLLAEIGYRYIHKKPLPRVVRGEPLLQWLAGFSGEGGSFHDQSLVAALNATEQPASIRSFATALRHRIAESL